ncbi:protein kinase [Paenibacillus oenotherae]|uniref:Protein kinase n=1 Tax=Paenibacillus oenotherae TaxID=1435645 RepID=A0ABS7D843_9BACL|nr:protein kinase [Paenibacillus oenotherae]MBW7476021.1 protein kinase [Paenibacillus oenotherae]
MFRYLQGWLQSVLNAWRDYPLRQGKVIAERYKLIRFIGMGSYGQAYAGVDLRSGSAVLIKLNKPSKGKAGLALLERESRIMADLSHAQIPAWIDYVGSGRRMALVMELLDGANLEERVMEQGMLFDERAAALVLRELLRPLAYLHATGYVHRDVRIPNVITNGHHVYLIDYGLACGIGEQLPADLAEALGEGEAGHENCSEAAASHERGLKHGGAGSSVSWGAVKRRMRQPEPGSDLYGIGHLALFLLYSGYTPTIEGAADKGWEQELQLSAPMAEWIRRSLGEGEPFVDAAQSASALGSAIESMDLSIHARAEPS